MLLPSAPTFDTLAVKISVLRAYTIFPDVSMDTEGSSRPSFTRHVNSHSMVDMHDPP